MSYFQRFWTKLDSGTKWNLFAMGLLVGAIIAIMLTITIAHHDTGAIIICSIALPVFVIGTPLLFGNSSLKMIENSEKEAEEDRQDFLNNEDSYLDRMAEAIAREVEWRIKFKELSAKQQRKFVTKVLYKMQRFR
jgi:hypothetical protein